MKNEKMSLQLSGVFILLTNHQEIVALTLAMPWSTVRYGKSGRMISLAER